MWLSVWIIVANARIKSQMPISLQLLTPVVEGILQNDMNRFAEYARERAED